MKFIVSSQSLLKHLQNSIGIIGSSTTLPILENFLFEIQSDELLITASDLDTTMITRISARCEEGGRVCVPGKLLMEVLKNLPDAPLSFLIDERTFLVELSTGEGKYRIAGFDPSEYPKTATPDTSDSVTFHTHVLADAINKTLFATASDEMRPSMNGIFCQISKDNITFAATDAHKLVRYRRNDMMGNEENSFILPKKPLNLIKGLLGGLDSEVKLDFGKQNAFFKVDNFSLICRLIDAKYPNYEAVIPTNNPNKLVVDRLGLLAACRRVSIFSNKTTHQVRLKISGSDLTISAEDFDYNNAATERHTCQYEGEDMEIGFNARFLIEMLNNLEGENVMFMLSAPNRAGILTPVDNDPEGEEILMLVMPVMITN
jgi:DNA polymerase-3 subunit beta